MMGARRILITGSNGLLGGKLVKHLLGATDFDVIAVASSEEKVNAMIEREGDIQFRERISFLSNEDFLKQDTDLTDVYGAVHLAFSRRIRTATEIAFSVDFALAAFTKLASTGIDRVINMSSQGIYGNTEEMRTEGTLPMPESPYTMAKYAAEVIFDSCMEQAKVSNFTNLRLDPVVQSQNLIKALCKQAKAGKLHLRGGEQRFSFVDADDAAKAVITMLRSPDGWDKIYNVGWNRRRYSLVEVAEIVADAAERQGYARPAIELDKQDIKLWAGMDSTRFTKHTGWVPQIDLKAMTAAIMRMV